MQIKINPSRTIESVFVKREQTIADLTKITLGGIFFDLVYETIAGANPNIGMIPLSKRDTMPFFLMMDVAGGLFFLE